MTRKSKSDPRRRSVRGALAQEVISGIKLPDSLIAREATELVRQHEPEILFNHSMRVYVFGSMKGTRQNIKFNPEVLYVAALFHDLGLVDKYHTETKRFEVDGADAAREFLRRTQSGPRLGSDRPPYDSRHSAIHAPRDCSYLGGCSRGRARNGV